VNTGSALLNDPFLSGVFIFAGLVCLVLEVFVPSGGILGLLAAGSAVFGVYGLFQQGHPFLASGVIFGFAGLFWWMFRFMVRRLSLPGSLPPETANSMDRRILDLVGREGITLTALRPSGMASIDGKKIDVVTQGEYIEKDVPVLVVDNSGNRVVVRQAESRSLKA
jgi:membrane-bound serine protease (ClpP class)